MKHKIISIAAKSVVGIFMALAILVPVRVFAFSYSDLKTAASNAAALCAARGTGSEYCSRADKYKMYAAAAAAKKTTTEKDKYANSIPKDLRTTIWTATTKDYDAEVKAGNIGSGSDSTSRINADSSCPDGQVEVAISPSSNGDNCIGGKNPIYTYLKAIILFMGGVIGLAVVITIIVSGIEYASSAGNAANITKAKERLTNAVIGLVLYLFLAAILRYIVPQIFS